MALGLRWDHGQHLNAVCGPYPLIVFGDERAQLECIADADLKRPAATSLMATPGVVRTRWRRRCQKTGSRWQGPRPANGLAVDRGVVSKQGDGRFGEPESAERLTEEVSPN